MYIKKEAVKRPPLSWRNSDQHLNQGFGAIYDALPVTDIVEPESSTDLLIALKLTAAKGALILSAVVTRIGLLIVTEVPFVLVKFN